MEPEFKAKQIHVDIKRDDLIDPIISGNKYRKLKAHLLDFRAQDYAGIVTMGGPWSNHVHALAKCCFDQGIPLTCIIRGPEPKQYSQMLRDVMNWQAELVFISRTDYRQLRESYRSTSSAHILNDYADYYFIPEGGFGSQALAGCRDIAAEITEHITEQYDYLYLAVGTGTTMAGLLAAESSGAKEIIGVCALDAGDSHKSTIKKLAVQNQTDWQLCRDFIGSGFAKSSEDLEDFMWQVYQDTGVITEPVYTAKALYALYQHVREDRFKPETRLLFLHTGGLQGLRGFNSDICQKLAAAAGF